MTARTEDIVAYGIARRALFQATPEELETMLSLAAERVPTMAAQLRLDEPGAADRAEQLACQLEGIRQQAVRLGVAIREHAQLAR